MIVYNDHAWLCLHLLPLWPFLQELQAPAPEDQFKLFAKSLHINVLRFLEEHGRLNVFNQSWTDGISGCVQSAVYVEAQVVGFNLIKTVVGLQSSKPLSSHWLKGILVWQWISRVSERESFTAGSMHYGVKRKGSVLSREGINPKSVEEMEGRQLLVKPSVSSLRECNRLAKKTETSLKQVNGGETVSDTGAKHGVKHGGETDS